MELVFSFPLFFFLYIVNAYTDELLDLTFDQRGSAFLINDKAKQTYDAPLLFASASNTDRYTLKTSLGFIHHPVTLLGDRILENSKVHVTVHTFDSEVSEETKTLHFLCHANLDDDSFNQNFDPHNICCIISINASFFSDLTSCTLNIDSNHRTWTCRAFIKFPSSVWKQKEPPEIALSYLAIRSPYDLSSSNSEYDRSRNCHLLQKPPENLFISLPPVNIVHSISDAIREIGRSLLLQIPRRELKTNEDFFVTVRLKKFEDVSDFTLRCEIPANTFVEFVRVIWPAGLNALSSNDLNSFPEQTDYPDTPSVNSHTIKADYKSRNLWDVFHRNIISSRRNVTEIVARFREDLATKTSSSSQYSPATEVYKLQFRVNKPIPSTSGRIAPRIFWSLVSLSRRNSPEHAVSSSPIVTRLNIEPSEIQHLTMVLKTSALVNLAVLTGHPSTYPVWVYGLTHDFKLIDLTSKATCHTGDDAVIHFAQEMCSKLGFSGAELDGSPGLPLVAKMDGRSATVTLLVWYPKNPALKLTIEPITTTTYESISSTKNLIHSNQNPTTQIVLKRLATEIVASHSNSYGKMWSVRSNLSEGVKFFQYYRIRVMARFILASSILHDKDVLGGRINQYVDVTEFTAHRLRLEYTHDELMINSFNDINNYANNSNLKLSSSSYTTNGLKFESPARLITIGGTLSNNDNHNYPNYNRYHNPIRLWLVGQHPGYVKIHLAPIDQSLISNSIPPGLIKQLRDQYLKETNLFTNLSDNFSLSMINNQQKQPSLNVRVTDETSIWPVGISTQLITDFDVFIDQPIHIDDESNAQLMSIKSTISTKSTFSSNLNKQNEHMPILSGIYSVQIQLKGSKLVHSGSINAEFNKPNSIKQRQTNLDYLFTPLKTFIGNENNYTEQNRKDTEQLHHPHHLQQQQQQDSHSKQGTPAGFLVVWVHMSDGTTILWNRMVEVYQQLYGNDKIPLKLSIKNCKPDLFWIDTQSNELIERKSRSFPNFKTDDYLKFTNFTNDKQTGTNKRFHRDTIRYSNYKNLLNKTSNYWSGPIVWFLQGGISFSGDILEVGLVSPNGETLVPQVRVNAVIVTSKNSLPFNEYIQINKQVPISNKDNQGIIQNPIAFKDAPGPWSHTTNTDESNIQSKVLSPPSSSLSYEDLRFGKNGPKNMKLLPKLNKFAHSTTDLNNEEKQSLLADVETENKEFSSDPEQTSGSRSALEMSMYILLGLFAVVGLVFAVNCGVVVARYRWEKLNHVRNQKQTTDLSNNFNSNEEFNNELSTTNSGFLTNWIKRLKITNDRKKNNNDKNNTTSINTTTTTTNTTTSTHMNVDNDNDKTPSTSISKSFNQNDKQNKKFTNSLFSHRQKHKPLLHRDTSWVWVGRQQVINSQEIDNIDQSLNLSDLNHTNTSTLLNKSVSLVQNKKIPILKRTQSGEPKKHSTTAVLSIGEADMLLLQSPYCENAWQDTIRSVSFDNGAQLNMHNKNNNNNNNHNNNSNRKLFPYPDVYLTALNQLNIMSIQNNEAQTLGRHPRRHTTALTQRNYQGQECSIRIISNPTTHQPNLEQSVNPDNQSYLSTYNENLNNSTSLTKSAIVGNFWSQNTNYIPVGSASASLHRKQNSIYYQTNKLNKPISGDNLFQLNSPTFNHVNLINFDRSAPKHPAPPIPSKYKQQNICNDKSQIDSTELINYKNWLKSEMMNRKIMKTESNIDNNNNNNNDHDNLQDWPIQLGPNRNEIISPSCPLSSPWQIRRLDKINKTNICNECSSMNIKNSTKLNGTKNVNDTTNHTNLTKLIESNETVFIKDENKFTDNNNNHNNDNNNNNNQDNMNSINQRQIPPYPPQRTTSRGLINYHTLGPLARIKHNNPNQNHTRPLSLPQSLHVTNDLYSVLNNPESSTDESKIIEPANKYLNTNLTDLNYPSDYDIKSIQKTNPSEESLWWYHPVKQKRKQKHKINNGNNLNQSRTNSFAPNCDINKVQPIKIADNYKVIQTKLVEANQTLSNLTGSTSTSTTDPIPNITINNNNNNNDTTTAITNQKQFNRMKSITDLCWDQDLFALSHDHLVAYFAGMKESNA